MNYFNTNSIFICISALFSLAAAADYRGMGGEGGLGPGMPMGGGSPNNLDGMNGGGMGGGDMGGGGY